MTGTKPGKTFMHMWFRGRSPVDFMTSPIMIGITNDTGDLDIIDDVKLFASKPILHKYVKREFPYIIWVALDKWEFHVDYDMENVVVVVYDDASRQVIFHYNTRREANKGYTIVVEYNNDVALAEIPDIPQLRTIRQGSDEEQRMSMADDKYCYKCGRELLSFTVEDDTSDTKTGKHETSTYKRCPVDACGHYGIAHKDRHYDGVDYMHCRVCNERWYIGGKYA